VKHLWRAWIDWTDRDIAGTWPLPFGIAGRVCVIPLLPNFIFAFVHVPQGLRLTILGLTAALSFVCIGVWGWRTMLYSLVTRPRELKRESKDC